MEMYYRRSRLFLALLLYSGTMQIVLAFNFNTERPVTSSNPSFASDPENRQLFGFQVVQYDPSPQSQDPAILVSAPKVDGMYTRQGGVYLCNPSSVCSLMDLFWETDNDLNTDIFKFPLSTNNASYEGEMLGFAVKAFPNNVVVCAPHYIKDILSVTYPTQTYRYGDRNGRCAIFNNDFSSREDLQLSPLEIPQLRLGGFDVEYINTTTFGDTIVLSSLLAGATGGRGRGQIFATSLDPSEISANVVPSTPGGSAEVTPELGYRMDSGYFTVDYTSPQRQIVVSAPRASLHRGTIEVCDVEAGEIICGRNINNLPLVTGPEDAVNGYFGSDFAVLDLQTGGSPGTYHSLAVGCPLCSGDRGVVYVYVHTGSISNPFDSPTILPSPNQVAGRFGLTITSVGDIDLDAYSDVAISAPFEGSGVVYIYRGYSGGLVADAYQAISALDDTRAFGYSLDAGIDLDRNGYPDLTVGDLSGTTVTNIMTNPLVAVQTELLEANTILDLTENRVCSSPELPEVVLVCFNVTPCFQYDPIGSAVPEFALEYKITADAEMGRIGLLEDMGNNTITGRVVLTSGVQECTESYVFFVRTNFTETTPIPIQVSISDSDDPIDVTTGGSSFVGDLFGMLNRYESGNQKTLLSTEYSVLFNVSCSGGSDPDQCEPDYVVTLDEDFTSVTSDNALILAENNVFGYEISIKNQAEDDGLSPQLYVNLPVGILFLRDRAESLTKGAVSECTSTQSTVVECQLKNPILSQSVIELKLFFTFNTSALPLEKESLEIEFIIVDGKTGFEEFSRIERITLDAIAGYNLALSVGQDEILADTIIVAQEIDDIPINETGPEVSFSFVLSHTLFDTNGTIIPRTLLKISFPNEILQDNNVIPLLIPTDIIRDPTTTCSHYNAIPEEFLSSAPIGFDIPAVVNETFDAHKDCALEGLRCGVILCTITDLEPNTIESTVPPVNLQLFARLYSPAVTTRINITVYATVESETELPKIDEDSITSAADSFIALPSTREAAKDCIPWWIVAVSVVAGIVVLCIIIFVLGCLGVFRRWYKTKKEEATMWMDHPDDNEFVYRQRTIPPIPGVNTARETSPELVAFRTTTTDDASNRKEKEAEAEAEREMELQLQMEQIRYPRIPRSSSPQPVVPAEEELEKYEFDPHKGIDEGYGGPFETEI